MKDPKQSQMKEQQSTANKNSSGGESENTSQPRRRAILASVAAAGASGLPSQWKKPVVDHILLPAHADMSIMSNTNPLTGTAIRTVSGYISCEYANTAVTEIYSINPSVSGSSGYTYTADYSYSYASACTDPLGEMTSGFYSGGSTYVNSSSGYPTSTYSSSNYSYSYSASNSATTFSETVTVVL